jgi:bacterial/archaeal transporter family protein
MASPSTPEPTSPAQARGDTAMWLVPTIIYIVTLGASGITSKLALDHLDWPDLVLWQTAGYALVVAVILARGHAKIRFNRGSAWAAATAVCAMIGLVSFFIALASGEASKVVPVSGAYPAMTLIMSALFLRERLTLGRVIGVVLVIIGVVIVTTS